MTHTEARFLALWTRCGGVRADAVYADLFRHYREPGRHYHTLQHVRRCLADLDWARATLGDALPDPDVVELALWCHDVIYIPGAHDNEARSADWLLHRADGALPAAGHIAAMIHATTHMGAPTDPATQFTVDIDLAVLGCPRYRFVRDGARLRAERSDLDDAGYDRVERRFLSTLLQRDALYHSALFHQRCEAQARANLAWRLAQAVPSWASGDAGGERNAGNAGDAGDAGDKADASAPVRETRS